MRNRSEPSQLVQAGFEPERIAVTHRVDSCYCESARCERLWRISFGKPPKEKRRKADKRSERIGKTTETGQVS